MAQKTTTTPLDLLTYTEWKTEGEVWAKIAYDDMSTAQKAVFDRLLNEAIEQAAQIGASRNIFRKAKR